MPKLTMNFIKTKVVPPASGQIIIRDDEVQGFGLRITPNSMSYIAECRVNGKVRRVTIGKHGRWTPESARKEARVILGKMSSGVDPKSEKEKARTSSLTLSQAFEEYMSSKEFRRNTILSFNRVMLQNLEDWQRKPVTSITRERCTNHTVVSKQTLVFDCARYQYTRQERV